MASGSDLLLRKPERDIWVAVRHSAKEKGVTYRTCPHCFQASTYTQGFRLEQPR